MSKRLPVALMAYQLASRAAAPLANQYLTYRLNQGKEIAGRMAERRGETKVARPPGPLVWLHGASVGELTAALPLIERIKARGVAMLVTTGTVTSAALARQRLPHGVIHQFAPLDVQNFVTRFLDHWKPSLTLIMEADLWPNTLLSCSKRGIPVILVNGRMSDRSFERWRRVPSAMEAMLRRFDLCLVSTQTDANRFSELGAPRLSVVGNLKLDVPQLPVDESRLAPLTTRLIGRNVLAAVSTHPGEEKTILDVHRWLKPSFPSLLTLITPRHPQRGAEVAALATGLNTVRRSAGRLPERSTEVYVFDTIGELGLVYRLAPLVFMGGSLVPHGGQNPIEAVKLGAAVLHGPFISNFAEIYAALDGARGASLVADAGQLATQASTLMKDSDERRRVVAAGQKAVEALGGALERTLVALDPYLMQLRLENRADA